MPFDFRIYLASHSPRRQELLQQVKIPFDLLLIDDDPGKEIIDESILPRETAENYVIRLARSKAEHSALQIKRKKLAPYPVLSADTTLDLHGQIIGKPQNTQEAKTILSSLSGEEHRVLTAVAITHQDQTLHTLSISHVRFCKLTEHEIDQYIMSGEPFGKAGAYGIQGQAALFIEHLSGSYSGVMGLPLFETGKLLKRFIEKLS